MRPLPLQEEPDPERFSPVAGIQWVETPTGYGGLGENLSVSVPLPGFSGLRPKAIAATCGTTECFSPVAGIQWVETY